MIPTSTACIARPLRIRRHNTDARDSELDSRYAESVSVHRPQRMTITANRTGDYRQALTAKCQAGNHDKKIDYRTTLTSVRACAALASTGNDGLEPGLVRARPVNAAAILAAGKLLVEFQRARWRLARSIGGTD